MNYPGLRFFVGVPEHRPVPARLAYIKVKFPRLMEWDPEIWEFRTAIYITARFHD